VGYGQGAGLSDVVDLGQVWGTESVTLSDLQLPAHTHDYTPVPEPTSVALLIAAGVALTGRRRRGH
jgi:hypothetical protein